MYEIETARTHLRIPTINDLDDLARIFGNPQVMKHLDIDCQPLSKEQTKTALISIINGWAKNNFGRWMVISKADDKIIGLAGFRRHEDISELFYVLDEPYWGKGLATEIASEILKAGFGRHGFPRIIAMTRPANAESRRVLEKLGMRFIGESVVYGISAVEYEIHEKEFQTNSQIKSI
jgi:ribosomal-protein-alanine N-acetyltransferase